MDPDLKKRWIDALESGEYAFGQGTLCRQDNKFDRFCCIGVLCDVVNPDGWDEGETRVWTNSAGNCSGTTLPYGGPVSLSLRAGGEQHLPKLIDINDAPFTVDFSRQIEYIKENL